MSLPDFGFTRKDKIILGVGFLFAIIALLVFYVFLNWKLDREFGNLTELPEITPRLNTSANLAIGSPSQTDALSSPTPLSLPTDFPLALLTPAPTPSWLAQWETYRDETAGIGFGYPSIFRVDHYLSDMGMTGFLIQDSSLNSPLIEILLTDWSLDQIKNRYPRLEFTPYSTNYFSGYQASYLSDKEDTRFFYLKKETGPSIWVIGRIGQFASQFPDLRYQEKENIIKRIIQSIDINR